MQKGYKERAVSHGHSLRQVILHDVLLSGGGSQFWWRGCGSGIDAGVRQGNLLHCLYLDFGMADQVSLDSLQQLAVAH